MKSHDQLLQEIFKSAGIKSNSIEIVLEMIKIKKNSSDKIQEVVEIK